MYLISPDTIDAELESSKISSSRNWVAGFNISKTQTFFLQFLVSQRISYGPAMSRSTQDVLSGYSLVNENWKVPPRAPGA